MKDNLVNSDINPNQDTTTINKRLEADLYAMKRLHNLSTLFIHKGNWNQVLMEIVDTAIAISDADFGNIQLLDAKSSKLKIVAQSGFPKWWLEFWNEVQEGQGVCGTALETGKRIIVEDVEKSPIFIGTPALDIQLKAGVHAVQSTPIVNRSGKPLGMFSTHFKKPHQPDERELQLLDLLAHQVADIIDREKYEETLQVTNEELHYQQEALIKSNQKISEILESIQNNFYVIDQNWNYVYINNQAANAVNKEPQDFIGQNHWKMFPQYVGTVMEENFYAAMEKREVRQFEIDSPYNSNTFLVTVNPSTEGITIVEINITERKNAEEDLNQSQKLLYDIINGFPSPIFVKDIEGRFIIINNKLEELLGAKNEEVKGKTDYDTITKELADYYRTNDQKVLEEGKAMLFEEEADLIDGKHTFIANKFPIYDINGKPYGIGSISTDITERKLLEEKVQNLADVVESLNDAIITKSLEGIITSWNKGAEKIYGYNSEEVIGKNISILVPSSLKNEISDLIEKIIQGKQILHYDTLRVKKNGALINVSITLSPIMDSSKKLVAISTISRDITESKKAEEKMQELLS